MSVLTYNDLALPWLKTEDVSFEPQYDDAGVDYLYTRASFSVDFHVYPAPFSGDPIVFPNQHPGPFLTAPQGGPETIDEAIKRLIHTLEQPGKRLTYQIADKTILDLNRTGKYTDPDGKEYDISQDARGGPWPRVTRLAEVQGDQGARFRFQIEAFVRECPGQDPPKYLSNRWREQTTIGEDGSTVSTRTGKVVTKYDFFRNADAMRGVATPLVEPGFKRMSANYLLQEDGLALQYTITDEEVYRQPLPGAYKMKCEFMETVQQLGGLRWGEFRISLKGAKLKGKTQNGRDLQQLQMQWFALLAINLARDRFVQAGMATLKAINETVGVSFPSEAEKKRAESLYSLLYTIKEDQGENPELTLNARTILKPRVQKGVRQTGAFKSQFSWVGQPFPGAMQNHVPPDVGLRGTAGLTLLAAAFNEPCLVAAVESYLESRSFGFEDQPVTLGGIDKAVNTAPAAASGVDPAVSGSNTTVSGPTPDPYQGPSAPNPLATLGVVPAGILTAEFTGDAYTVGGAYTDYRIRTNYVVDPGVSAPIVAVGVPGLPPPPPGSPPPPGPPVPAPPPGIPLAAWQELSMGFGKSGDWTEDMSGDAHRLFLKLYFTPGFKPVSHVQLSAPSIRMEVRWTAERELEPPVVPDPNPRNPDIIYLAGETEIGELEALPGTQDACRYRISGRYVYSFEKPWLTVFGAGVPQWMSDIDTGLVVLGKAPKPEDVYQALAKAVFRPGLGILAHLFLAQ